MSNYTDFIKNPISHKIVLLEIDQGSILGDSLWEKYSPGVWKTTYSWESGKSVSTTAYGVGTWGSGTYGKTSATELSTSPREEINVVASLEVDGEEHILVSDVSSVQTTPKSFYWSSAEQLIYVNYDGYIRNSDINLGIVIGYASESLYFNNVYYDGRIKSIPNISQKRDNLFDGKMITLGGTITLINTDGHFDHFGDRDVYGKKARLKFGGDDLQYSDYDTIYTGYLEDFNLKDGDITISIKDERKNLERKIPNNYHSGTDLKKTGDEIPIGYGIISGGIATCLNENDKTATTYNFQFVDTTLHNIESIDTVYVNGVEVAYTNASLINGSFDLAPTVYEPGQKVSVDFSGYVDDNNVLIENPLNIIEDLLLVYANIIYTSDFYNTTDWDILKPSLNNINLWIKKSKSLKDVISMISNSILGTFIVEGDGRFNMKAVDLSKTAIKTIKVDELLDSPKQDNPSSEYISSTRIGYSQTYSEKKYNYYINDDEEEDLVTKYRSYKQKDFNTLLTNITDASDFSDTIMSLFGGIIPEYTIKTKMQNIDIELEDIVNIEIYKFNNDIYGTIKCEVIGKNVNYKSNEITFALKWISDVTADLNLAELIKWKPNATYNVGNVSSSGGRLWIATELNENKIPSITSSFWQAYLYVAGDGGIGPLKYNGNVRINGALYGGTDNPVSTERLNYDGYFHATRIYNAVYNDLAEYFLSREGEIKRRIYCVDKDGYAKLACKRSSTNVIGICSDSAAFIMKQEYEDKGVLIGLAGTVIVDIYGSVKPGDLIVSYKKYGIGIKANWFERTFKRSAIVGKVIKQIGNDTASVRII